MLRLSVDARILRVYFKLVEAIRDFEDSARSQLILESNRLSLGPKADMDVTEIELLLDEDALAFLNDALAPHLFICAVLNLERQNVLVYLRPWWEE